MTDHLSRQKRNNAQLAAFGILIVGATLLVISEKPHPGSHDLPDFPDGDIAQHKEAFFAFLAPIAAHHNDRIRDERAFLLSIDENSGPAWWHRRRFAALAERYDVDVDKLGFPEAFARLKRRVDVIPPALVLVQAAKESGWGRSRFAREGNALFGEWCFTEGCGMVPARRAKGRRHEVREFDTVHDAVASYMDNLNSHRSYRELRAARAEMRDDGEKLSALNLAEHLSLYSERGKVYAEEISRMIISNGLESRR
ncbi:MAG: hypothetical protein HKN35_16145 [Woeseia sp.]|nr:glucosaminidase domain-containing protein [Woeseia sp.]MBT8095730.1 glucosaminidase domain-containing protein [Woeseia sp.]NNE62425.1 hypothetical protein [Woeseia sp.]NNL55366.1 hypothetical protein [Woeseia sp.]